MPTQINGTMKAYGDNLSILLPSIHNSFNILYLNIYTLFPKISLNSFSRLDHGFACFILLWRFWLLLFFSVDVIFCFVLFISKKTEILKHLDEKSKEGSHI